MRSCPRAACHQALRSTPFSFLLGCLLAALSPTGQAQGQPPAPLPEVQVTASRDPLPASQAIADVTIIEREQLSRHPARNLPELLSLQPGVDIAISGGLGATSSLYLRGSNSNHVLVLIDGVRFGSATAGNPALENLPLAHIERIEIVRGPMSSLYGSDAIGGVIQIFTRSGQGADKAFMPNLSLAAGSQGFGQLGAGFSGRQGVLDYRLQWQQTRTDGFSATNERVAGFAPYGTFHPDNDGFSQGSLSANLGWRLLPDWALRLAVIDSRGRTRFDEGYDPTRPALSGAGRIQSQNLSLALEGRVRDAWTTRLAWGQSRDVSRVDQALNSFFLGRFETVQQQLNWSNQWSLPSGQWSFGAEHLQQRVSLEDPFGTPNYDPDQRRINSLWLGWRRQFGDWQWQLNGRRDHNSQFGARTTGNLGAAWRLNEHWRLQGSIGNAFAAPSFNNLYFPFFGNPALKAEASVSREIGLRFNGTLGGSPAVVPVAGSAASTAGNTPTEIKLVAFDQRVRDLIVVDPTLFTPVNLDSASIRGLSLQWRHLARGWSLSGSLDLTHAVNDSTGAQQGNWLPRRARQNLRIAYDRSWGPWQVGASLRAAGRRYDDAANSTAMGGYGVVDLRARLPLSPDWSLGLHLNNVGNKVYETAYGYNQPGRIAVVNLSWQPR